MMREQLEAAEARLIEKINTAESGEMSEDCFDGLMEELAVVQVALMRVTYAE